MTLATWWRHTRWRLYAPVYDYVAKPFEQGRQLAIDHLDLRPTDRILVLGCGTGLDLPYLPRNATVTAVDVVPTNLRRTTARAAGRGRELHVCLGDAQTLPFEDAAFDAVLLHLVLSVVPDPSAVVAEASRVLVGDGRVSIYDKFLPDGATPSVTRRLLNPPARLLFSDLTRQLEPILSDTDLVVNHREWLLGDLYSVAIARKGGSLS